jgi:adenylate cyclase
VEVIVARLIVRMDLTAEAKPRFDRAVDRMGMTQVAAAERLIVWLSEQHPGVQGAVLGQWPEGIKKDVAQLMLEKEIGVRSK